VIAFRILSLGGAPGPAIVISGDDIIGHRVKETSPTEDG
jgi:hypothetical protein